MKRNILFLSILFLAQSCFWPMDQGFAIRVKNNSDRIIYFYGGYILPDTTLSNHKPDLKIVKSHKTAFLSDSNVNDEEFRRLSSEKLTIFILAKDTVDKYDWETIRNDYKILARKEVMESDLEDGYSVSYP